MLFIKCHFTLVPDSGVTPFSFFLVLSLLLHPMLLLYNIITRRVREGGREGRKAVDSLAFSIPVHSTQGDFVDSSVQPCPRFYPKKMIISSLVTWL